MRENADIVAFFMEHFRNAATEIEIEYAEGTPAKALSKRVQKLSQRVYLVEQLFDQIADDEAEEDDKA